MKLMVLGRYGPFPAPGGACSSYLIEGPKLPGKTGPDDEKVRIVIDLGAGALSRLLSVCPIKNIDAVILSHLHSDHMSDMLVLRYALQQYRARGVNVPMPLHVIAPSEPEAEFRLLSSSGTFNMVRAEDKLKVKFGALSITLHRMYHPVPSYAVDILEEEETRPRTYGPKQPQKRFFYTGDTGLHDGIVPACADATLLLADTGMLAREKTAEFAPHLTAKEAGEIARDAGVGALLCTHVWGGGVADEQILDEARLAFANTEVAQEMRLYEI